MFHPFTRLSLKVVSILGELQGISLHKAVCTWLKDISCRSYDAKFCMSNATLSIDSTIYGILTVSNTHVYGCRCVGEILDHLYGLSYPDI